MEMKKEVLNAFQLLALLSLLFWSFSWNFPKNFDSESARHQRNLPNVRRHEEERNRHFDDRGEGSYGVKKTERTQKSIRNPDLPTFETWKKGEIVKQDSSQPGAALRKPSTSKRNLNYASAKCGAKVLAANREAKYAAAVLNDKVDEYMLNPCQAKAWLIIELCDTVHATQIEIANFELFSSSPKKFSAFWSGSYPTKTWQLLGTFTPDNRRSVQTFHLDTDNLGKFIKINISGHYGKEHYCPLSVVRVLGYSIIYEFEEIDENKPSLKKDNIVLKPKKSEEGQKSTKITETIVGHLTCKSNYISIFFGKEREQCFSKTLLPAYFGEKVHNYVSNGSCLNPPTISVFKYIAFSTTTCSGIIEKCPLKELSSVDSSTFSNRIRTQNSEQLSFCSGTHQCPRKLSDILKMLSEAENKRNIFERNLNTRKQFRKENKGQTKFDENIGNTNESLPQQHKEEKNILEPEKTITTVTDIFPIEADKRESAALIQKESVLVKLSLRIKNSEVNLNFINKYLQKLSKSYHQQMEDMQFVFNKTSKILKSAAINSIILNEQQQLKIENLKSDVETLSKKVKYWEQRDERLLKQVLELHGFFLILEFIIVSTIFSIFLNKFRQNELKIKSKLNFSRGERNSGFEIKFS